MSKIYLFLTRFICIALIGLIPVMGFAQDEEPENKEKKEKQTRKEKRADFDKFFYLNINAGANWNHTDIAVNKWFPPTDSWRLGYGAYFGWQFSPIWGTRLKFSNGLLNGAKENEVLLPTQSQSAWYQASVTDIHLDLTIDIINLLAGYKERPVSLFVHGGIGQSQWKTKSYDKASGAEWRNNGYGNDVPQMTGDGHGSGDGVASDRTRTFNVPFGGGVQFHVSPKVDITLDFDVKVVDSDRLDTWTKGSMAIKKDMYSTNTIGVSYKFGKSNPLKQMEKDWDLPTFVTTPDPLEEHGGKVKVKVIGTFPEKYFHEKAAMEFTPRLVYDGGEVILSTVYLKGEDVAGDGILIPKSGGTFTYEDEIDYFPELKASELVVAPTAFLPKDPLDENFTVEDISKYKFVELGGVKLADGVISTPERFNNSEIALFAPHGYEKVTILSEMANIYFPVNRHILNWRLPLNKLDANKQTLQELYDFIALGYEIKDINFDGWASPEGEETFNEGLSEKRANAAHKYVVSKIEKLVKAKGSKIKVKDPENEIRFNLNHHGPDWNGFLANVQSSNMKDKNIILNVINSAGTPAKKEQEIRNMVVIYPQIEENLLPPLRRAEITVNCFEPKRSDEEIGGLAMSAPRDLTQEELLYSATLTDDPNEKLEIYKAAINIFPNSYKGYANAGNIEIEMEELTAAKGHLTTALELAPNAGEVYNNLGIVYAMEGDFAKAEENFLKAQELGEDVNYNLGIVNIVKGEYTKAVNLLKSQPCDYNLGLAQLLAKDYSAAEKTLKCAPADAGTHYLLAIVGSRTDNTGMMYENLTKAIQLDPAMASEIAMDREFISYFEAPEFKALAQ